MTPVMLRLLLSCDDVTQPLVDPSNTATVDPAPSATSVPGILGPYQAHDTGDVTNDTGEVPCVEGPPVYDVEAPSPPRTIAGNISLLDANVRIEGVEKEHWLGRQVNPYPGDANGDGVPDLLVSFAGPEVTEGGVSLFFGPLAPGIFGEQTAADVVVTGVLGSYPAVYLVDVDLDGRSELAAVERYDSNNYTMWQIPEEPGVYKADQLESVLRIETLGSAAVGLTPVRDVTHDAIGDIWVSQLGTQLPDDSTVSLHAGPLSGELFVEAAVATYTQTGGDMVLGLMQQGHGMGIGDLDADGTTDLMVGAMQQDIITDIYSFAFVVTDPPLVVSDIRDVALTEFVGVLNSLDGGRASALVGDINDDGYEDLAFGQSYSLGIGEEYDSGALYLHYGPPRAGITKFECASTILTSAPPDGNVGYIEHGDFDGDGYDDIVASRDNGNPDWVSAFEHHVFYGPVATGSFDVLSSDAVIGDTENGLDTVQNVGDVSGDGIDDLAIGQDGAGFNGLYSGAVYVLFGGIP